MGRSRTPIYETLKECLEETKTITGKSKLIPHRIKYQNKEFFILGASTTGVLAVFARSLGVEGEVVPVNELVKALKE